MENAKCQKDFSTSPLRPRTRSMTKMLKKDNTCIQTQTQDMLSGIEESDRQEDRDYLENKSKPTQMTNQDFEYSQKLMNRMHPQAEQRDDCTLYVRIFFCQSNILPNDDHFSQKD